MSPVQSEGHSHHNHEHQQSLNKTAAQATLHCMTGCAIGEVLGMVTGTFFAIGNLQTVFISILLAFLFGYSLTMMPLLKQGLPFIKASQLALVSDTASITTMEIVDNILMLFIPGAMSAGLLTFTFWGSLVLSMIVAGLCAFPVNRWLISQGTGHAKVHQYHQAH